MSSLKKQAGFTLIQLLTGMLLISFFLSLLDIGYASREENIKVRGAYQRAIALNNDAYLEMLSSGVPDDETTENKQYAGIKYTLTKTPRGQVYTEFQSLDSKVYRVVHRASRGTTSSVHKCLLYQKC